MLESGKEKDLIIYSVRFKNRVVEEIRGRRSSINEMSYKHKIPPSTIRGWISRSAIGDEKELTSKMEVTMKDQEEKIKELQAALSDAHIKLMVYEKMIEIAKDEHGVEFKKTQLPGNTSL